MDYKERMKTEYREVKERYDKLHKMLVRYDAGKLKFTPTCPIELLKEQASVMGRYLYILETRAIIEDVDLFAQPTEKETINESLQKEIDEGLLHDLPDFH